ncbi:MAG: hypothetical protein ACUVRS_03330 [Armatimonadota bacterium]
MPFPWTDAQNPVVVAGRLKPGEAVLVDLAPTSSGTFTLIASSVRMADVQGSDSMRDLIRGWFEPPMPIADFLAEHSRAGGTHHAALVYGDVMQEIVRFGEMMGWNVVRI